MRDKSWESINGFLAEAIEDRRFPGAVLTIVEDGAVTVSRGYGYSDMEAESVVDPAETGFRLSSASGLLTAMAMLKLAEDGELRLEDEAAEYVPELETALNQRKPLRLINLINHSDGLPECFLDTASLQADRCLPLKGFISKHIAPAVCEPGKLITFGNMSMAIAGCIIENVSGTTYAEYIKEKILGPLGMNGTCVYPDQNTSHLRIAAPYGFDKGVLVRLPEIFSNIPPADGILSTGKDMGRLLSFLLQGGASEVKDILGSRSIEKIKNSGFSPVAGLPGVTCGFFECPVCGGRGLVRKGKGPGGASMVCILPELNAGFFLAMNIRDERIMDRLAGDIFEGLWSSDDPEPAGKPVDAPDLGEYCGDYHFVQWNRKSIAKYMSLSKSLLRVEHDETDKGSLKIIPLGSGDSLGGFKETTRWQPLEGDLFKCRNENLVAFKRDGKGKPFELCSSQGFHGCYERTGWHESAGFYSALAGLFMIVFLTAVLISPAFIFRGKELAGIPFILLGITALLNFSFLVSIQPVVLNNGSIDGTPSLYFNGSSHPALRVILAVPLVTAALTVALIVFSVVAWSQSYWSVSQRTLITLFAVISLAFMLFLNRLKLLGYRY